MKRTLRIDSYQIPSPAAEGVDGLHDLAVLLAVAVAGAAVDGVVGEDEAGEQGQEGGEDEETHALVLLENAAEFRG